MKSKKFRASPSNVNKGQQVYRSKYEAEFAALLLSLRIRFEYEPDSFEYTVTHKYTPDFKVYNEDGSYQYVETKGYLNPRSKIALSCMRKQHPEVKIHINYMKNNKGYKQWAEKYEYESSIGLQEAERLFGTEGKVSQEPDEIAASVTKKSRHSRSKA